MGKVSFVVGPASLLINGRRSVAVDRDDQRAG
jgi:hypothetical protein